MLPQYKNDQENGSFCIIAYGSNLPLSSEVTESPVEVALELLTRESVEIVKYSHKYRTPAFPPGAGPDFENGAVLLRTSMSRNALLGVLHQVEAQVGRTRDQRWEARVVDLDLIDYGGQVAPDLTTYRHWVDLPLEDQMQKAPQELILPHPRVQDRPFVLVPMRDIAPDWVHPVSGISLDKLIEVFDPSELQEIQRIS